ncbi:hypothetical protein [Paenibacillus eucommiae]|uniref:Lipoprotein n=1 Tax=Paenibacillus eucommiae TaxID=1355755 RepID=A0ABS4J0E2_9BACL|nr:hypothetical protein [Paenibacillus eucommiae]MBP1993307.1 hypothetical protein [Paenibacillus eucommiae]
MKRLPKNIFNLAFLLAAFILLALFAAGCTSYTKVSTDQLKNFQKQIRAEHAQLNSLQVRFSPASLQFTYSLKKEIDETERLDIFYKTKELLLSTQFQSEVIEGKFFKKYFTEERIYPQASISFQIQKEAESQATFHSSYYQTSDVSSEEARQLVDGYQTWSFWDYKNDPVTVPPRE